MDRTAHGQGVTWVSTAVVMRRADRRGWAGHGRCVPRGAAGGWSGEENPSHRCAGRFCEIKYLAVKRQAISRLRGWRNWPVASRATCRPRPKCDGHEIADRTREKRCLNRSRTFTAGIHGLVSRVSIPAARVWVPTGG